MKKIIAFVFTLLFIISCAEQQKQSYDYDVIVYSGTSAGVMAAYTAKKLGKKVLLVEPGKHLGGLSSSGLGETDIGNKYTVSGLSRDFYRRLGQHYGAFEAWRFEPHVAEATFNQYISEAGVEVLYEYRIIGADKSGKQLTSITLESSKAPQEASNKTFTAAQFIDASYEGDLLARAGVSYIVGRESNAQYSETYNGIRPIVKSNQVPDGIDPYIVPGDSTSGLIWGVSNRAVGKAGEADKKMQAYNYRLCLSSDTANQVPFAKPANYDPATYEVLRRTIQKRDEAKWTQRIHQLYLRVSPMPNQKTDVNNKGGFSTDMIGHSWEYPEASYERRKEIEKAHRAYIEGLLYFLANDPDVPAHVKEQMLQYGWAKDEFLDNGHFPHQIYVREARRLIGDYVMTDHYCLGEKTVSDTIAMGAYNIDSHHGARHVINGMVKNEGEMQEPIDPYAIAFGVLLPKKSECSNLLVAACVSASHAAYGSVRMEPVFMMLGQAAGVAATMAIEEGKAVQEITGKAVQTALRQNPLADGTPAEIVLNNEDASTVIMGEWTASNKKYTDKYFKTYLVRDGAAPIEQKVTFNTQVPKAGNYEVFFYVTGEGRKDIKERANAVPISFNVSGGSLETMVDMSENLEGWISLGVHELAKDSFSLTVDATGIEQEVIADAVILKPVE